MKITTIELLNVLPFEEAFKTNLRESWDGLSQDQKIAIGQLLWDSYAEVYQIRFETNTELALLEVADEKGKLDNELYKKVKEKTDKEMQQQLHKEISESTLAQTRDALQNILDKPKHESN